MTKIRLASDIHLDFDIYNFNRSRRMVAPEVREAGEMNFLWRPPLMAEDLETTFVIAGDLWTNRKFLNRLYPDGLSWIEKISQQFKYVVMVLGNHDFWGTNITYETQKTKEAIGHLKNVFLLEKDTLILGDTKYVGATLWTDYNKHDRDLMYDAPNRMNDYKKIRQGAGYGRIHASHLYAIHQESRLYIAEHAKKDYSAQNLMVVTHMPPSLRSLPQIYQDNPGPTNYLYASDLEDMIAESEIDYWFHGHTHVNSNYQIGNTKIIANPRGYVNEKDVGFDESFVMELKEKKKSLKLR